MSNAKRTPPPAADGPYTRIDFHRCRNAFGPDFWQIGIHHENGISWVAPGSMKGGKAGAK